MASRSECFNRPKAVVCLATQYEVEHVPVSQEVSIARRRLVVLRPAAVLWQQVGDARGFNRPKAISCLATAGRVPARLPGG